MQLNVHFYSYFKDLTGVNETTLDLPEPCTLGEVKSAVLERYEKLRPMSRSMLVAVDLDYQLPDFVLSGKPVISFFPPVQGG